MGRALSPVGLKSDWPTGSGGRPTSLVPQTFPKHRSELGEYRCEAQDSRMATCFNDVFEAPREEVEGKAALR